jgi:hypothetical protein
MTPCVVAEAFPAREELAAGRDHVRAGLEHPHDLVDVE